MWRLESIKVIPPYIKSEECTALCMIQLSGVLDKSKKCDTLKAAESKPVIGWAAPTGIYRPVWMSKNRITNQVNIYVGLPSLCFSSRISWSTCGIGYYHTKRVIASSEPHTTSTERTKNMQGSKDIINTEQSKPWDVTAIQRVISEERAQSGHSSVGVGNNPNLAAKGHNSEKQGGASPRTQSVPSGHSSEQSGVLRGYNVSSSNGTQRVPEEGTSKSHLVTFVTCRDYTVPTGTGGAGAGGASRYLEGLKAGSRVNDKDGVQVVRELLKGDSKSGIYHNLIGIIADVRFLIGCYEEIKGKPGNMTRGTDRKTLDGVSLGWFERLAEELREGSFSFNPARRTEIPKAKGGTRPLGIGNPREKIVQKALTVVLEGIWETIFENSSHGFRPGRSCHTALKVIYLEGNTYRWVIQGDISKCFDRIPHRIIEKEIGKKVKCERTRELIKSYLKAGYIESNNPNKVVRSDRGVPQGGILSPLLSNIVLDLFDKYMSRLKERFDKGEQRDVSREYHRLNGRVGYYRKTGKIEKVLELRKLRDKMPSRDQRDDGFRRLKYVRYADDFIVMVNGPAREVVKMKSEIKNALNINCGLELSNEKTLITRMNKWFTFLGAAIRNKAHWEKMYNVTKRGIRRIRNERTMVGVPIMDIVKKLETQGITKKGVGTRVKSLVFIDHADILKYFNRKLRGLANYYKFAFNYSRLGIVSWRLMESCALTLASKFKLDTKAKVFKKFGSNLKDPVTGVEFYKFREKHRREFKGKLELDIKELEAILREKWMKFTRSGLGKTCVICGSKKVEMHHIRSIKDVRMKYRNENLTTGEFKGALLRKQIPLCSEHHRDLHKGTLSREQINRIKNYRD